MVTKTTHKTGVKKHQVSKREEQMVFPPMTVNVVDKEGGFVALTSCGPMYNHDHGSKVKGILEEFRYTKNGFITATYNILGNQEAMVFFDPKNGKRISFLELIRIEREQREKSGRKSR